MIVILKIILQWQYLYCLKLVLNNFLGQHKIVSGKANTPQIYETFHKKESFINLHKMNG